MTIRVLVRIGKEGLAGRLSKLVYNFASSRALKISTEENVDGGCDGAKSSSQGKCYLEHGVYA